MERFRDKRTLNSHFLEAASKADLGKMEFLYNQGADINVQRDFSKDSALHEVSFIGDLPCVEWLIGHGANCNAVDTLGKTPLYKAMVKGNFECGEFLIKSGTDINSQDVEGETVLHACSRDFNSINVDELLRFKPKLNIQNREGLTALQIAVKMGNVNGLFSLLSAGADVEILDNKNRKAIDLAKTPDISKAIEDYMKAKHELESLNEIISKAKDSDASLNINF